MVKKTTKHKSTSVAHKPSSKKEVSKAHKEATTKVKSSKNDSKKQYHKDPAIWIVAILILIGIIAVIINSPNDSSTPTKTGVVTLVEFTDYGCPFCSKAYATIETLKDEYGDSLKVIHKNFPIPSLHKTSPKAHEAAECAKDQGEFDEYRAWLFGNPRSHDLSSLRKGASDLGLDLAKFNTCLDTNAKASIVNIDVTEGKAKGVTGTPAFFINGESIVGAQPIAKFRALIDASLDPNGTIKTAEELAIEIVLLTDSRCDDCDDLAYAKSILEQQMPKATFKTVDYDTVEGKKLYAEYNLEFIPAVLFGKEIESYDIYSELQGNLKDVEDYYYLPVQPHDPTAEICTNGVDDTENGLADCADPACSKTQTCNPDVFLDCAKELNITQQDTVVFYYSDSCPHCLKMKPFVEELQGEGYNFVWDQGSDASGIVRSCLTEIIGDGVPEFICLNSAEVQVGAFPDIDGLREFANACTASMQ